MHVQTHLLSGWCLGNAFGLQKRGRTLAIAAAGLPDLDGLGIVGNDAHALTEWVDMASLPRRAALLAELLLDLGT